MQNNFKVNLSKIFCGYSKLCLALKFQNIQKSAFKCLNDSFYLYYLFLIGSLEGNKWPFLSKNRSGLNANGSSNSFSSWWTVQKFGTIWNEQNFVNLVSFQRKKASRNLILLYAYYSVFLDSVSFNSDLFRSSMEDGQRNMGYVTQCFEDERFSQMAVLSIRKTRFPVRPNRAINFFLQGFLKFWSLCKKYDHSHNCASSRQMTCLESKYFLPKIVDI